MSASSLQRILDAAAPQIEQACREGRGEELLLDFHRSVAVDFADSCFLKMDAEVTAATEETVAGVYEWLQVFPTVAINDLAGCVRRTFAATTRRTEKLQAKGKGVDFPALLRIEPDSGTTNIRNTASANWKRWLGPENRCVVPFTSFSEFNRDAGGDIWFAFDETPPLAFFAGLWTTWTSVRKVREGEVTADLYGFLTTAPNAEVGAVHPQAMPVILTNQAEVEQWMTAPVDEALMLQRPLPDGSLTIVARGVKKDGASLSSLAE